MKPFRFIMLLSVCLGLVYLTSCDRREEPIVPQPVDPCANGTTFKADFDIIDGSWRDASSPTDTVSTFQFMVIAKHDYDSCVWQIGTDPRTFVGKEVGLRLPDETTGKRITVKMIAKRKPEMRCLANDNGMDTIIKSFVVVMSPDHDLYQIYNSRYVPPLVGIWEGSTLDEPNKKFKIRVVHLPYDGGSFYGYRLYNFPEGAGGPFPQACGGDIINVNTWFTTPELRMTHNVFERTDNTSGSLIPGTQRIGCLPPFSARGRIDSTNRNRMIMDFIIRDRDSITGNFFTARKSTFIGIRQ